MIRQKHTTWTSRYISSTVRENKPRERVKIQVDQDIRKTDNGRSRGIVDWSSVFCSDAERLVTMFPTVGRSRGRSDSNHSPEGNEVNVVDTRSRKILSLEESMIGEFHYSAQDTHTWLLDSGVTFHVTPDIKWFANYSAGTSGTVRLGNGQECKIAEPENFSSNCRMKT